MHITGIDPAEFERNGLARDAVERCLKRICEASHRLGARAAEPMPHQPWGEIRGMGNRSRHAYDRLDLGLVWSTVRYRVPALGAEARRALERLLAERGDPG